MATTRKLILAPASSHRLTDILKTSAQQDVAENVTPGIIQILMATEIVMLVSVALASLTTRVRQLNA